MWKNYLNMVLRGIWKYKTYSIINILGLAVGLSCCLLILLYVQYELSYDRYHENVERTYRVSLHGVLAGNEINAVTTPYPMAAALVNEFPEVATATRFRKFFLEMLVSVDDIRYQESEVFHADQEFFEIFDYDFIAGSMATALENSYSVVITESIAKKYFPDSNALGQSLTFNNDREYQITGVINEVPENTHFHPQFLVSFNSDEDHDSPIWISNNIATYLTLRPGVDVTEFAPKLTDLVDKYVAPQIEQALGFSVEEFFASGGRYEYDLQPLTAIHLNSNMQGEIESNGNAAYVTTFLAIALFVLALACINFMNLPAARSANRAKEIGVRKVVGAQRAQLLIQFMAESILISLLALAIALPIVSLLLPAFNAITERSMSLDVIFSLQAMLLISFLTFAVGCISGSYPALYLSRFHPQEVLKGKFSGGAKSAWFRSTLVIFQFAISIALVAATLIVYSQLEYMRNKPLGFEKEQLLLVHRASALGEQLESFKIRVAAQANVQAVSSSVHVPGVEVDQNVYILEGDPASETRAIWATSVGYDYIETLQIEVLEGRSFSREFGSDETAYVINEAAARELGIEDPTSHGLLEPDPSGMRSGPIIGMVKDFHFESLHQEIRPMLFRYQEFARYVVIRVQADNTQQTINEVEDLWEEITAGEPFEYSFLDEDFAKLHQGDRKMGEVFTVFSLLAILIACLGLYGLASYTTEQRTKEIGVRKTLGASVSDIVVLISKEFILLVLIALLAAVPVCYFAMSQWLQLFSYRIAIPISAFAIAGVLALIIAFLTVSFQSIKTALTNPAYTLRDE
tara:strand:- start:4169 stop:6580 length:2412 start_codon:yes stop_codon:yes gene_type:complete